MPLGYLFICFALCFSLAGALYEVHMKGKTTIPKAILLTSTNCLDKNLFTIIATKTTSKILNMLPLTIQNERWVKYLTS